MLNCSLGRSFVGMVHALDFKYHKVASTKGQVISKFSFGVFKYPQKQTVSAVASKKRSNQKNNGTYNTNWRILF